MASFDRSKMVESFTVGPELVKRLSSFVERAQRGGAMLLGGMRAPVTRADVLRGLLVLGLESAERDMDKSPGASKTAKAGGR